MLRKLKRNYSQLPSPFNKHCQQLKLRHWLDNQLVHRANPSAVAGALVSSKLILPKVGY